MNTRVIDQLEGMKDVSGLRVRTASSRVSPIRRFRNFIELGDWDESIAPARQGDRRFLLAARRRDGSTIASGVLSCAEKLGLTNLTGHMVYSSGQGGQSDALERDLCHG